MLHPRFIISKNQNNLNSFLSDTNNRVCLIRTKSAKPLRNLRHIQSTLIPLQHTPICTPSSNVHTTTCMTPFPTTPWNPHNILYSSTAQTASLSLFRAYAKNTTNNTCRPIHPTPSIYHLLTCLASIIFSPPFLSAPPFFQLALFLPTTKPPHPKSSSYYKYVPLLCLAIFSPRLHKYLCHAFATFATARFEQLALCFFLFSLSFILCPSFSSDFWPPSLPSNHLVLVEEIHRSNALSWCMQSTFLRIHLLYVITCRYLMKEHTKLRVNR